ncbi:MAG: Uncharacterised protein [Flavobacteriia bacterium]|nr:MAG: Uncharacterised protein [Flavobacteriia bacterium]
MNQLLNKRNMWFFDTPHQDPQIFLGSDSAQERIIQPISGAQIR